MPNESQLMIEAAEQFRNRLPRVAVIGAGVCGLTCGRSLADHGIAVTVFDKGRAPGGRLATRRAEPSLSFDHGAQYFTARHPDFIRVVRHMQDQGTAAEWPGRVVRLEAGVIVDCNPQTRYVGVPGMSAVAAFLAANLDVRRQMRINLLKRNHTGWVLTDEGGNPHGPYDFIVVTLPAPQTVELIGRQMFAAELAAIAMAPCWAVMAAFEQRLELPWDGAFVHGSSLAWLCRNSSKPGRSPSPECWVLHAGPEWSAIHLEESPDAIAALLLAEFSTVTGVSLPPTVYLSAHRWRYSQGAHAEDRRVLFDPAAGLAIGGDWLAGGRVEGAYLAGITTAGHILRAIGIATADAETP